VDRLRLASPDRERADPAGSRWCDVIPFSDETPVRRFPVVTISLIALCIIVFFAVQPTHLKTRDLLRPDLGGDSAEQLRFAVDNAAIPCEILKGRPLTEREYRATFFGGDDSACSGRDGPRHSPHKLVYLALFATMFLHANTQHLFGNLLFLWVFGNDIEHRWGRIRYLLLYLLGGLAASFAHVFLNPNSTVPMIGASGAIAAVMGAYAVCYPSTRVKSIIWFGPMLLRKVKAIWLMLVFLLTQLLYIPGGSGVAWAAHLGGFAFGAVVGLLWRRRGREPAPPPLVPHPVAL
jgi:membrane associated rhomboid family serine protease